MNASTLRHRLKASLSADDLAKKIENAGNRLAAANATLVQYPGDEGARLSARESAREILWACDKLEALTR